MIVSRFTSFTENFVIRPRNLGSQADVAISVLRDLSKDTFAYPIPLLLAALKIIHEKNWVRLGVLGQCYP